jgi:hypothetical protein
MGVGGAGGGGAPSCGSPTRADGTCVAGAFRRAGVCACQSDTPCVCGAGCVDLLTDDDNCGACGHPCGPTSTCIQGVCGPPVVNVLPAQPRCGSIDLAVGGDTLYWTERDHFAVRSVPLAGGAVTTISSAEKSPARIATVGGGKHVFWTFLDTTIRHAVGNMVVKDVVNWSSPIGGFVVSPDGGTAYFAAGTSVWRTANGAQPSEVAREELGGVPRALAISGNQLAYVTDLDADVDLVTLKDGQTASCGADNDGNFLGFNCVRLARSQGSLFMDAIFATPKQVIWADGPTVKTEATNLGMVAFDVIAQTVQDSVTGMAMSSNEIYFADTNLDSGYGVIYKAPAQPGQVAIRIARDQLRPRSLAVGGKKVYWSTANCTIESQDL